MTCPVAELSVVEYRSTCTKTPFPLIQPLFIIIMIIITYIYNALNDALSAYLSDLLRVYSPSRQLRSSSNSRTLRILHIKTKTSGHRSFSHAAPSIWNTLPREIRHIQLTAAFKIALKANLFKILPLLAKSVLPPPFFCKLHYLTC